LPFLKLGETVFRPPHPARTMHPSSVRVLRQTLPLMDAEAAVRTRNADRFRAQQRRLNPATLIRVAADSRPGWLRLPVRLPTDQRIDETTAARLGVRRSYPRPLGSLDEIRRCLIGVPDTPGASDLCARLWTLTIHSALDERDLAALEHWLGEHCGAASPMGTGAR
jgi:dTDP-4-amino-4,6-dideoxygalactose transaminase